MSVLGGDSWAREAQHRKRRVDDLMRDNPTSSTHASSYQRLSNGKYACLVCPNSPVLDSLLMLSMHGKGSRHIAAASKLREQELLRQEEINKRIALAGHSTKTTLCSSSWKPEKPLIDLTRKATAAGLGQCVKIGPCNAASRGASVDLKHQIGSWERAKDENSEMADSNFDWTLSEPSLALRKQRERELKFVEAGWKRDCHGKWFRDENVEFDSDEEDPNECLKNGAELF